MTKQEIVRMLDTIALECEKQGEKENDKVAYFLSATINFGLEVVGKAFRDKSFDVINKASELMLKMLPELEGKGEEKESGNHIIIKGPKDIQ